MKFLRNPAVIAIILFFVVGIILDAGLKAWLKIDMVTPHPSFAPEPVFEIGGQQVTNSVIMTIIVMAAIVFFFWWNTRKISLVPSRGQNFAEMIVEFLVNLVESTAGKRTGRVILPLVA